MKSTVVKYIVLIWFTCYGKSFNINSEYLPGLEPSIENVTETDDENVDSTVMKQSVVEVFNITDLSLLRFATPCETPNGEVSYCVQINDCPVLNSVREKKKYSQYVEASHCGPRNENKMNFKVCCGKYNSFRKVSNPIEYTDILPKKCGMQQFIISGRIYGGTTAVLKEYPWMARIIHKNSKGAKSYGCAGFLIHTKYIITAGHCMKSNSTKFKGDPYSVVLGEHDVDKKIDCSPRNTICADPLQISRVLETAVHPQYNEQSRDHHNDIAIIHLKKAAKLTDYVQPICLLTDTEISAKTFYISGWGKTETAETSPIKMKLGLPSYDKEECQIKFKLLSLNIDDTQLCAGGEKLKDSCSGDSGGPLMIRANNSVHYAAGLVSYGIGCGMEGWPGVYTKISSFIPWIKTEMLKMGVADRQARLFKKHAKKQGKTL